MGLIVASRLPGSDRFLVSFPIAPPANWDELTASERDVARRLLQGQSNRDIARRRETSERTVANQVASIFRKLGISSRTELAALNGSRAASCAAR